MANTNWREPTDGGDNNVWGPYEQNQNRLSLGLISCRLYDDSGALKLGKGRIGLDNGSSKGVCVIDTITEIDMSGVSISNWAKIEITNSGTTVIITATDIAGANDETTLPSGFTDAYDGEKASFYITATKRCIGLAWKNASGVLEGIINILSSTDGYIGYSISDDASNYRYQFFKAGFYEPYKLFTLKKEITADETVTAGTKRQQLICKTNDLRINLPALATFDEFELTIFNAESKMIHLNPNGAETICGIADLFSKQENDCIIIEKIDGKYRVTNGWMPYFHSGWINRSVYANIHMGDGVIVYDTLVGAFRLGEKVTGANGSYGWVVYDNGSTSLVLKWVVCVGATVFANNEAITGELSGATALVNMASGLKNVDSNIYHGWGKNRRQILVALSISTNATENASFDTDNVGYDTNSGSSSQFGHTIYQVDANYLKNQTGLQTLFYLNDSGAIATLGTSDYYYNILTKLLSW